MSKFTPPAYLSPSSMSTFEQCPLKFKFAKLDLLPDEPSEATLLGNFVHSVLEDFYALEPAHRTAPVAKELAKQIWHEFGWEERVIPWIPSGPDSLRSFRWNAWWCIENLWKIEDPEKVTPTGIELELNGDLGGVTLKGFIDRLSSDDRGVVISDYKTGKTPRKNWVEGKFLQLQIYASLVGELGIADCSTLELLYLKDGVKLVYDFTDERKQQTTAYVQNVKKSLDICCESGDFPAQPSVLCNWCAYKPICPQWK